MPEAFYSQSYISFGPSCLSAEILRACQLRKATFGFDWFRSGSYSHSLFLKYDVDQFVNHCVIRPSLPLRQDSCVSHTNSFTSGLARRNPLYGYDVLFNPHRDYIPSTFAYFRRSFTRLNLRLACSHMSEPPVIILADYINKPHYNHIPDTEEAALFLGSCFLLRYGYAPQIIFLRFLLTTAEEFLGRDLVSIRKNTHTVHTIPISAMIDESVELRRLFYTSLLPLLTND
jgi:hypothetical protein